MRYSWTKFPWHTDWLRNQYCWQNQLCTYPRNWDISTHTPSEAMYNVTADLISQNYRHHGLPTRLEHLRSCDIRTANLHVWKYYKIFYWINLRVHRNGSSCFFFFKFLLTEKSLLTLFRCAVRINHLDPPKEKHRKKDRWKLLTNTTCCYPLMMQGKYHQTVLVRPHTAHLTKHLRKTSETPLKK